MATAAGPEPAELSYIGLRRAVGVIGVALPFVLAIGHFLLSGEVLRSSLSSFYYTGMRDVFVGSLCAIGVFLLCYRYERTDGWLAGLAGVAAIGTALFPTTPNPSTGTAATVVGWVHLSFATVFFALLAYFCLALFTRDDGAPTSRKLLRNAVYRTSGWVIVACLLLAVVNASVVPSRIADGWHVLFWLEAVAVVAFGVAWFVKGDTVLRDVTVRD